MQENRVHDREDRRVQPKSECQRNHRNRAESTILQQHAETEFQVRRKVTRPAVNPSPAAVFLRQGDISKCTMRCMPGFVGFHSALHVFVCFHINMRLDFIIELARDLVGPKGRSQLRDFAMDAHDSPFPLVLRVFRRGWAEDARDCFAESLPLAVLS